jgi:hypothetical protein
VPFVSYAVHIRQLTAESPDPPEPLVVDKPQSTRVEGADMCVRTRLYCGVGGVVWTESTQAVTKNVVIRGLDRLKRSINCQNPVFTITLSA